MLTPRTCATAASRSCVSELKGTPNGERAEKAGFEVLSAAEATKQADVIMMLVPDQTQAVVYKNDVAPNLKDGATLMFAHGFNIHFGQIVPPTTVDVTMVAPKGPGHLVRRQYEEGKGVPVLIAVYQDASGKAREQALVVRQAASAACAPASSRPPSRRRPRPTSSASRPCSAAAAPSSSRPGSRPWSRPATSRRSPTSSACTSSSSSSTSCRRSGIAGMRYSISDTAEYGDLTRGPRVIDANVRETMAEILGEIQSGEFAREWIIENQANRPVYGALKRQGKEHLIETVGKELRGMMSWIDDESGFDIDV